MSWWRRVFGKSTAGAIEQQVAKHYKSAQSYYEQLSFARAERELREVLRLKPDCAEAHDLLSSILTHLGKGEPGQHAREAIRLRPDSAQLRANLGNELLFEWKYAEAE